LAFLTEFIISLFAGILTLFVILDPIGALPFFQAFTVDLSDEERNKLAQRSVLIAMGLLLVFAYLGALILNLLGIGIYDFEVAGGLLLLIFALRDALFSEPLGAKDTSSAKEKSTSTNKVRVLDTIAVIPIATPLLAGPGSLTTVMLLTQSKQGLEGLVIGGVAILVDCGLALAAFRMSGKLNKWIGPSGLLIIGKVMDILMAAIAVSYLFHGIQGIVQVTGL
jgi:multiple antibiotic resistance protein